MGRSPPGRLGRLERLLAPGPGADSGLRDVLGERERHVVPAEAERVDERRHRYAGRRWVERARACGDVDGHRVDPRVPGERVLKGLQDDDARALAEHEPVPAFIEWPGRALRLVVPRGHG